MFESLEHWITFDSWNTMTQSRSLAKVWVTLGSNWGINKAMAQIHALLLRSGSQKHCLQTDVFFSLTSSIRMKYWRIVLTNYLLWDSI